MLNANPRYPETVQHLDIPVHNAAALMQALDKDHDGKISYQEFRAGFALLNPTDFSALKDSWMEFLDDGSDTGVSVHEGSRTEKRELKKAGVPAWGAGVAGAMAASTSRTVSR